MAAPLLTLLRLVPKNLVSSLAGRVTSLRLPSPMRRPAIGAFGRTFGVDFAEVVGPLDSYASIQEFFTRPLPPGVRPLEGDESTVVAPCDGAWGTAGIVSAGTLLQVKGRSYSLAALLGSAADAAAFEGGAYATFYLAPRNYHRFHAPCAGRVARLRYLPGSLWPVNRIGVEGIEALFASNERMCAFLEVGAEKRSLCLVAVGATMVGKVRVNFDDLTTNAGGKVAVERDYGGAGPALARGEEWGRFEFGSTIVLVAAASLMELDVREPGTELVLGRRIGRLRS